MYLDKFSFIRINKKMLFSMLIFISPFSYSASIGIERTNYQEAIEAIENKDLVKFQKLKKALADYPLYPYLDYRDFSLQLNNMPYKKVAAFERKYKDLAFSDTIRNRYLSLLAREKNWKHFIKYQKVEPSSIVHQCNYYFAHSQVGNKRLALNGAKKLFLSGDSVTSACDKLFQVLKNKGELTDNLILERILLAFERGNKGLLRYLTKKLSLKNKRTASQVLAYYQNPSKVLELTTRSRISTYQNRLYQHAFKRLVKIDPVQATRNFYSVANVLRLGQSQRQELSEYIVRKIMFTSNAELAVWRDRQLSKSHNTSLLEQRFRIALTANNKNDRMRWINLMPLEDQKKPKWQYWRARSFFDQGKAEEAQKLLQSILGKRDFYSVAAAMHLNESISIPLQSTDPAFEQLKPFKKALARVSELEIMNKISESNSEWQGILQKANRKQKAILAAHAFDKGWHAHSIQATISGKLWEHLEYRFPVAHRWFFERFSKENNLPITTLLALSRQESAFHAEAVSPVGARGLMQLMPTTARETSSKLGLNYMGVDTLSDPGTNIRLGSGYFRLLLDKFEQNRVLAFAAYNAGPNRVDQWLQQSQGNLDVISFIEGIPFYETRGYVQNVLMYEIYYRKLLGMPMQFIQDRELAYRY